ncbi:MAG: hypothetical protein ACI86H_000778 [bacterium]|jgi:hypothetical protein
MRTQFYLFLCILLFLGTSQVVAQKRSMAIQSNFTLKVSNRQLAAESIMKKLTSMGGYFSKKSDQFLVLKVPQKSVKKFLVFAKLQGLSFGENYQVRYVGDQLARLQARVKSKEELLVAYFKVLDRAGDKDILEVEKAVTHLIHDIEKFKGQIYFLQHRIQYAVVTIFFKFRQKTAPRRTYSSFPWLNQVNLQLLVREFQ